jgi:hypothetical protein
MSTTNFNQNEWRTTHSILPTLSWRDLSMTLRQALNEDKLRSAICVQNIDVQCPAIHTISRILLRPSSTYEPTLIGSIFIGLLTSLTKTWQASIFSPLTTIASEPHTP